MKSFERFLIEATKDEIEQEVAAASAALKAFPKGPTGMTPDNVKFSPEYRAAKERYQRAFEALRTINAAARKSK